MIQPRCDQCRWWEDRDGMGICRRNPPTIVVEIMNAYIRAGDDHLEEHPSDLAGGHWPQTVGEEDWCGEFQPAVKEKP